MYAFISLDQFNACVHFCVIEYVYRDILIRDGHILNASLDWSYASLAIKIETESPTRCMLFFVKNV